MQSLLKPFDSFLPGKRVWLVFAGVFLLGFTFALYTNNAWEDWFITYRASRNLATGNGLVFTPGERVHTFTSPLGVLIPALFSFATGNAADAPVLWLFRVVCCALLGFTAMLLVRIGQLTGMRLLPAAVVVGLFALDAKTIQFSTNGQETAFMVFFLAAACYLLIAPVRNFVVLLGAVCAGLMWTRPDSFVYIAGLALGYLLFKPASPHFDSRRTMLKKFVLGGLVTALLYAPWLAWTWWYYGSPIPHTIIAKYGLYGQKLDATILLKLVTFPYQAIFGASSVVTTFMPTNSSYGGWPVVMSYGLGLLALPCLFYWCVPIASPRGRALSLAVFLAHFYLSYFTPFIFPWYVPSVTLLSILVLGQIIDDLARRGEQSSGWTQHRLKAALLCTGCGCLLLVSLTVTLLSAYQVKLQQEIIETGNRKAIGLFLRDHAASAKDSVFLECLGYIGYYSQLKMYDFPGLASPEVVAARRKLATDDYGELIRYLHPDWLVLRPFEVEKVEKQQPDLLSLQYRGVKLFDVSAKLDAVQFLPGRGLLEYDQTFMVYKRNPAASVIQEPSDAPENE